MIRKYVFGKPFETYSCVRALPAESGQLPYFTVAQEEKGLSFRLHWPDDPRARRVADIDSGTVRMIGWLEREYGYEMYDDDGVSRAVSLDSTRILPAYPGKS